MSNDNKPPEHKPSGTIIPFKIRQEDGYYLRGSACCIDCEWEWEAVAPVGVRALECPNCGGLGGRYDGKFTRGNELYRCNCGSIDLRMNAEFIYCSACGLPASTS